MRHRLQVAGALDQPDFRLAVRQFLQPKRIVARCRAVVRTVDEQKGPVGERRDLPLRLDRLEIHAAEDATPEPRHLPPWPDQLGATPDRGSRRITMYYADRSATVYIHVRSMKDK